MSFKCWSFKQCWRPLIRKQLCLKSISDSFCTIERTRKGKGEVSVVNSAPAAACSPISPACRRPTAALAPFLHARPRSSFAVAAQAAAGASRSFVVPFIAQGWSPSSSFLLPTAGRGPIAVANSSPLPQVGSIPHAPRFVCSLRFSPTRSRPLSLQESSTGRVPTVAARHHRRVPPHRGQRVSLQISSSQSLF